MANLGQPACCLITLARLFVDFRPGDRMIDLGPGNGAAISLAEYLLPNPELGCIEYSGRTISFLRRHVPDIAVAKAVDDLIGRWGPESVMMLYSAHCFEHFGAAELAAALPRLRRAMRPGGVLAVEVPFAPPARVAATSKHTPHLIFFTHQGLQALLERHGFRVRLCVVGPGSTRNNAKWIQRNYPAPSPDVVGGEIAERIAVLNTKDFISRDPATIEAKCGAGVIKCIAVR